jgi:hypothetical protein
MGDVFQDVFKQQMKTNFPDNWKTFAVIDGIENQS